MRKICSFVTIVAIGFGTIAVAIAPVESKPVETQTSELRPVEPEPVRDTTVVPTADNVHGPFVPPVGKRKGVIKGKIPKRVAAFRWALRQKGKPYIWGGVGPRGYDCSGLVVKAYKSVGISLPRTTYQLLASSKLKRIDPRKARAGDILFPHSGHVEFFTAKRGQMFGAHHSGTLISAKAIYNIWRAYRVVGA